MSDRILNFINGEVQKYIIPDIERLKGLRPQGSEGLAACTIPTAMFLFVISDFFGYLVRNDKKKPKQNDTKGNLDAIFTHQLTKFSSEYSDRLDTLVGLFRNGLMHQIFPKLLVSGKRTMLINYLIILMGLITLMLIVLL